MALTKGKSGGKRAKASTNPNAMTDRDIVDRFEEEGYSLTDNPREAIYVLRNGDLIDGFYGSRQRTEDHRMVEALFDDIDRYTDDFWKQMYDRTKMVQLIPETKTAIVFSKDTKDVTPKQKSIIKSLGYKIING